MGSTRALVKLLDGMFASFPEGNPVQDIPQPALERIEEYVESHDTFESNSDSKLFEELEKLYAKHIATHPEFQAVFLQCLRFLARCFVREEQITHWASRAIAQAVDSAGGRNDAVDASRSFVRSVLLLDNVHYNDDRIAEHKKRAAELITRKLIEVFVHRSDLVDFSDREADSKLEEQRRFVVFNARNLLVAYGTRKSKEFFCIVTPYFRDPTFRLPILTLLSAVLSKQSPHTYQIADTELLDDLLKCLLYDKSSSAVEICSSVLVMIMPHICNRLGPYLPRLFAGFCRLVCWKDAVGLDTDGPTSPPISPDQTPREPEPTVVDGWRVLQKHFSTKAQQSPQYARLFTFFYGLYPLNLVKYLRDPMAELEAHGLDPDKLHIWDPYTIKSAAKSLLKRHVCHQNFILMDAEEELVGTRRWENSGTAEDIAAECVMLYLGEGDVLQESPIGSPVNSPLSPLSPVATKDIDMLMDDHRILFSKSEAGGGGGGSGGSEMISAGNTVVGTPGIVGTVESKETNTGTTGNSVTTVSTPTVHSSSTQNSSADSEKPTQVSNSSLVYYQRELLLLTNELEFSAYVKQLNQNLVKKLKEQQIQDSRELSLIHNSVLSNRLLKNQLTKATAEYNKLRDQFQRYKNDRLKYEEMLVSRTREVKSREAELLKEVEELKHSESDLQALLSTAQTGLEQARSRIAELENEVRCIAGEEQSQSTDKWLSGGSGTNSVSGSTSTDGDVSSESPTVSPSAREREMQLEIALDTAKKQLAALEQRSSAQESALCRRVQQLEQEVADMRADPAFLMKSQLVQFNQKQQNKINQLQSQVDILLSVIDKNESRIQQLMQKTLEERDRSAKSPSRPSIRSDEDSSGHGSPAPISSAEILNNQIPKPRFNSTTTIRVRGRGGLQNHSMKPGTPKQKSKPFMM